MTTFLKKIVVWMRRHYIVSLLVALFIVVIVPDWKSVTPTVPSPPNATVSAKPVDHPAVTNTVEAEKTVAVPKPAVDLPSDPTEHFQALLNSINKEFSVSVWADNNKGEWAKAKTPGVWDITVNAPFQNSYDCFGAKNTLKDVVLAVFTDKKYGNKVGRVLLTIPHQFDASVGASDAMPMLKSGLMQSSGSSNFWAMLHKSSNDQRVEYGPLQNRSWGNPANTDCQ